jgi:hypothetical protein
MAFLDMYQEITGLVPKMSVDYAMTLINRAWRDIRRQNLWSFQMFESNWVSPNLINTGTCTVNQGSTTVTFDATASAVLAAIYPGGPLPNGLLSRQFRVGISTIYNIWAVTATTTGFNEGGFNEGGFGGTPIVTITLDRPYTDASGTGVGFTIFQCYYAAPYQDFWCWINVRDIVNFNNLNINGTRKDVDKMDPQRTLDYLPTWVVPYQQDMNPASPTYTWPLFELWGQPQYSLTYQLYGIRRGVQLVNDTDTLPPPIGEDVVIALASAYAYQWAEGTKGDMPRNVGSDFKFLIGSTMAEYKRLYKDYRRQDRELIDNYYNVYNRPQIFTNVWGYYNSIGMTANPGAAWD